MIIKYEKPYEFYQAEHNYRAILADILRHGHSRSDRTGVGTTSFFGGQFCTSLATVFPLLSGKALHFKSIVAELLWMLRGDTNIKSLNDQGVTIWDEWADANGDLGPIYGWQWRKGPVDQIKALEHGLRANPFSRRHLISAWRPEDLDHMALPPCHVSAQFYVGTNADGVPSILSCHMYQRSADFFLGVPYNIASYALLTCMLAKTRGWTPADLIISYGDMHIYDNHIEQVGEYLDRVPLRPAPTLNLRLPLPWECADPNTPSILDFSMSDISLSDYNPYPAIKASVAV